jgi:hypothetical protein
MNRVELAEKAILPLVSVLAGWLLAQVTGIFRDYFRNRRIRRCLIEELKDLLLEIRRTRLFYERALQIYGLKGVEASVPSRLNNYIFRNYYKDAVLGLNANQRISFEMIHTLVEGINDDMNVVGKLAGELNTKNTLANSSGFTENDGQVWGSKIRAVYRNVAAAEWHVRYHLEHVRSPDLSPYTEHHKRYLAYLESVAREIDRILGSAKSLRREDFEKVGIPFPWPGEG